MVIGSLQGGGAERALSDMANYWAKRGWQITLATWSGRDVPDFYPIATNIDRVWLDVHSPNDSPLAKIKSNIFRIFKLRYLLKTVKPDGILSFIDVSNVLTVLAALGLEVRVIISERTNPSMNIRVPRFWRLMRRITYRMASQVVAQTKDAAKWIEETCGTSVAVIPNALRSLPKMQGAREPIVIAVGRLSKEKGLDVLLKAFSKIDGNFMDWRIVVIGDGEEKLPLSELCCRLKIDAKVQFIGQIQNVEDWMCRASLFVHSSRREGFPNVVLEAMGMEMAVICADCHSGPAELIQDGVNGRLVPVDDVDKLAEVMGELMASVDQRNRLGFEAIRVRQTYAQGVIMRRWEACLFLPS
jgi:GalNAc-alpha-(1->4)-GalNAc-alpha-(1->3)-diNAcBac-PP-undecaprenol alpha-1,4-N-acetyl-D-galactosaminyltransferase